MPQKSNSGMHSPWLTPSCVTQSHPLLCPGHHCKHPSVWPKTPLATSGPSRPPHCLGKSPRTIVPSLRLTRCTDAPAISGPPIRQGVNADGTLVPQPPRRKTQDVQDQWDQGGQTVEDTLYLTEFEQKRQHNSLYNEVTL